MKQIYYESERDSAKVILLPDLLDFEQQKIPSFGGCLEKTFDIHLTLTPEMFDEEVVVLYYQSQL